MRINTFITIVLLFFVAFQLNAQRAHYYPISELANKKIYSYNNAGASPTAGYIMTDSLYNWIRDTLVATTGGAYLPQDMLFYGNIQDTATYSDALRFQAHIQSFDLTIGRDADRTPWGNNSLTKPLGPGFIVYGKWDNLDTTYSKYGPAGVLNVAQNEALRYQLFAGEPTPTDSKAPNISMYRYKGSFSYAGFDPFENLSPLDSNTLLGSYTMGGTGGSLFENTATMEARSTQDWSPTALGSKLQFYTTPNNSTTKQEGLVIDQNGQLQASQYPGAFETDTINRVATFGQDGKVWYRSLSSLADSLDFENYATASLTATPGAKTHDLSNAGLIREEFSGTFITFFEKSGSKWEGQIYDTSDKNSMWFRFRDADGFIRSATVGTGQDSRVFIDQTYIELDGNSTVVRLDTVGFAHQYLDTEYSAFDSIAVYRGDGYQDWVSKSTFLDTIAANNLWTLNTFGFNSIYYQDGPVLIGTNIPNPSYDLIVDGDAEIGNTLAVGQISVAHSNPTASVDIAGDIRFRNLLPEDNTLDTFLVMDGLGYAKYRTFDSVLDSINANGVTIAEPAAQVVFGTGTGIDSDPNFNFNDGRLYVGREQNTNVDSAAAEIRRTYNGIAASPIATMILRNTGDVVGGSDYQNEVHLVLQTGTTSTHRRYLNFRGHDGIDDGVMGMNAANSLIWYNADDDTHWLTFETDATGGRSYINSIGTGAVEINKGDASEPNRSPNGVKIYDAVMSRGAGIQLDHANISLGHNVSRSAGYHLNIGGQFFDTGMNGGILFEAPTDLTEFSGSYYGIRMFDFTLPSSGFQNALRLGFSAGTNKYNIYADGTAQNVIVGNTLFGAAGSATENVDVAGGARVRTMPADNTLESFVVEDGTGVLHTRSFDSVLDSINTNSLWTDTGTALHPSEISRRVGIGTTSPGRELHVVEDAGAISAEFESTSNTASYIYLTGTGGSSYFGHSGPFDIYSQSGDTYLRTAGDVNRLYAMDYTAPSNSYGQYSGDRYNHFYDGVATNTAFANPAATSFFHKLRTDALLHVDSTFYDRNAAQGSVGDIAVSQGILGFEWTDPDSLTGVGLWTLNGSTAHLKDITKRIAVGSSTAGKDLDVKFTSVIGSPAENNPGIALTNTNNINGGINLGGLHFRRHNSSDIARTMALIDGQSVDFTAGSEDAEIRFSTMTGGTLSEKMTLNNLGYLGIGATGPLYPLHVVGQSYFTTQMGIGIVPTAGSQLRIQSSGTGTAPISLVASAGSSYANFYESGANDLWFRMADNAGTNTIQLHSYADSYLMNQVGFGNNNPQYQIDVQSTGGTGQVVARFKETASLNAFILFENNTAGSLRFGASGGDAYISPTNGDTYFTTVGVNSDLFVMDDAGTGSDFGRYTGQYMQLTDDGSALVQFNRNADSWINNSNGLAIGGTSATEDLDIYNTMRVRGMANDNTLSSFVVEDGTGVFHTRSFASIIDSIEANPLNGHWTRSGTSLYPTNIGDKVKIGTTLGINPNALVSAYGWIETGTNVATTGANIIAPRYSGDDNLGMISSQFGTGGIVIGYGTTGEGSTSNTDLRSTFDNFSGNRSALAVTSGIDFYTATAQATAVGSPITGLGRVMAVNQAGNLAVGGSHSPSYVVDAQNANGGNLARFKDTDSAYDGLILWGDNNGSGISNRVGLVTGEGFLLQNSISAIRVYAAGAEQGRWTTDGLSINTTSTGYSLRVSGNTYLEDNLTLRGQFYDYNNSNGVTWQLPGRNSSGGLQFRNYFGSRSTGGTLDWNDQSNTRAGSGYTLLLSSATNGPNVGSHYFHPFNIEYSGQDGTGNVTQLAIPYSISSTLDQGLFYRGRYSGTWSNWHRIVTSTNYTDVIPETGYWARSGTVTYLGNLGDNVSLGGTVSPYKLTVGGDAYFTAGIGANITPNSAVALRGQSFGPSTSMTELKASTGASTLNIFEDGSNNLWMRMADQAGTPYLQFTPASGNYLLSATSIGSTSFPEKFYVSGGNQLMDNNYYLKWKDSGGTSQSILRLASDDDVQLIAPANEDMKFMDGGNINMFIQGSSGNVGVNTTSVGGFTFNVNGSMATIPGSGGYLYLYESDAVRNNRLIAGADITGAFIRGAYSSGGTANVSIRDISNNVIALFESSTGNLGLGGVLTPDAELTLPGTVTVGPKKINLYEGLGYGFGVSASDLDYYSATNHRFFTNSTISTEGNERMTILGSNGYVGIGTSLPTHKLEVSNGTYSTFLEPATIGWTRNTTSYLWNVTAGGFIAMGTNGRATSTANANLVLATTQQSYFNDRLGVGIAAPQAALHAFSVAAGTPAARIQAIGGQTEDILQVMGSSLQDYLIVEADGDVHITQSLKDKDGDEGTSGQILSSTVAGIDWVDPGTLTSSNIRNSGGNFDGDYIQWGNGYKLDIRGLDSLHVRVEKSGVIGDITFLDEWKILNIDSTANTMSGWNAINDDWLFLGLMNGNKSSYSFTAGLEVRRMTGPDEEFANIVTNSTQYDGSLLIASTTRTNHAEWTPWRVPGTAPADGVQFLNFDTDVATWLPAFKEIAPTAPSTSQDDWNPSGLGDAQETMIWVACTADTDLTGLGDSGGGTLQDGQTVTLINSSNFNLTLKFNTGSAAGNQFEKLPGNTDLVLGPGDAARIVKGSVVTDGLICIAHGL